ncbi:WD40 repeat domain-containing protein [Streptomyces sp. NPDC002671]
MTTSSDRRVSLPDRAALERVVEGATSPQAVVQELLGARQLWWQYCSEAVLTDPSWLSDGRGEDLRAWLNDTVPGRATDSVTTADHAWLLGRALTAAEDRDGGHDRGRDGALNLLAEAWQQSRLVSADAAPGPAQLSGKGLERLSPRVAGGLKAVIERIEARCDTTVEHPERTGPTSVLVLAALLMAGAEPRRRPVVSVPVVFGRSAGPTGQDTAEAEEGVTGVLELREFPAGPAGLYPDPRAMAGVRSPNGQFADSLGHAWNAVGSRREGRCVLWRLVVSDDPLPPAQIEDPSLGAAFALGLRDLLRYPPSRRPSMASLRRAFYGLRPRTAVTGALDGGGRLLQVSDMNAKLLAARRKGLRLVAPEANRLDVTQAPEPGEVKLAATLRQADRYARRFRTGRLAIALALVATATTTAVVVTQQDAAATQRLTTAHRLAEVSLSLLPSDVTLAELFAVQAYRYHPDPLTRTALFQSVTASPHLAGSVQAGGPVSALASSTDGHIALAGTRQGEVRQWTLTGTTAGRERRLGRLPGSVTSLAADTDGGTVAAIDHNTVRVWATARRTTAPQTPAGQHPTAVAVSPSGRFIAVTTTTGVYAAPPTLWVLDRTTGSTRHLKLHMDSDATALAFSDDANVMAFESAYGSWQRTSLPALARTAGSTVSFGVTYQASALAPDGSYFTYTNGSPTLPIWPSKGAPDVDKPALLARTQAGHPATALALSRDGSWAGEAVGSTIYVSRTAASGQTPSAPISLTGAGTVSQGALAFLGRDGTRLLSASGDMVSLWDLGQYSRVATGVGTTIPTSCNGCGGPRVALSPNGRSGAVIDGFGNTLTLLGLDPPGAGGKSFSSNGQLTGGQGYASVLWQDDNSRVIVMSALDGSAKILSPSQGFRITGTWPPAPNPLQIPDPAALLQFSPDGRQVAEMDTSGAIRLRDAATGKALRQLDGPRDMAPTGRSSQVLPQGRAALDSTAGHAAVIDMSSPDLKSDKVVVTDTATGRSRLLPGGNALGVAFAGDRLLVQRDSGALEVWTASGDRRLSTLEGTPHMSVGPAVGGRVIAEKPDDDTVRLIDLTSGHTLGTLQLPPGSKARSTGLAVSADGTELVTATESYGDVSGDTGTLIAWKLDPNAWTRAACTSAGRDLTPAVWNRYMGSSPPSNLRCPT